MKFSWYFSYRRNYGIMEIPDRKLQEKEYTGVLNNFCNADLKMQIEDLE